MRLYVWNDPYHVSYGGSILYVVAETEEQARELAVAAPVAAFGNIREEGQKWDFKLGAADRVLDLPCAEIYEWSE